MRALRNFMLLCSLSLILPSLTTAQSEHPTLAIGAPLRIFASPGWTAKRTALKDYASSKILVVAFICNHCPTSQLYETRIKQLAADYKDKGVALVAIEPNNPDAVRLNEMGYTDVGDSFEDMKIRAEFRQFNFPYLYDGETQKVTTPTGRPPRRTFSSSMRSENYATKDASTTTPENRWSPSATRAVRSTCYWQASRWRSPRLLRLAVRPNGSTKKKAAARKWRRSNNVRST